MEILIDSANIEDIRRLNEQYAIDGVTTNPSLLAKENKNYLDVLKEIRVTIGNEKMLHVQTIATTAKEMVEEAHNIKDLLGGNIYIKVPVTKEGYKAMKHLTSLGINTLATAVFTANQALMAIKCGANYVAPYVNRIDNVSGDGIKTVSAIVKLIESYGFQSKVVAASFKNVNQVYQCSMARAHAVTCSPEIIEHYVSHQSTDSSVDQFTNDWVKAFNKNRF